VYPTYQQLFSVPESLGAEVSLWRLRPEQGFVPDVHELEKLVKANTKVCNNKLLQKQKQYQRFIHFGLLVQGANPTTKDDCH